MKKRKIIYLEFYSPWHYGGYNTNTLNGNNDLFSAVAFVVSETDEVLNLALAESDGNYLHQMRIPKGCIKPGTLVELHRPMSHPEVNDASNN